MRLWPKAWAPKLPQRRGARGKPDTLNTGVRAAGYPVVCCTKADIIPEGDTLPRVTRPHDQIPESDRRGGIVRELAGEGRRGASPGGDGVRLTIPRLVHQVADAPDFDSLADRYTEGDVLATRIPWRMLGFTDP